MPPRTAVRILWLAVCIAVASAGYAEEPLWSFGWITDTQTPECNWIASLLTEVKENRPIMLIHTGDTRFEWANPCAWREVMVLLRSASPPVEFHLAPGDHDLEHGVLKKHLRRAATQGIYRLDTGQLAPGAGYYHDRVTRFASGPEWPVWNPEIVDHPAWQADADQQPSDGSVPYRYTFNRGGIRFIVCTTYYTEEQREWIRRVITRPDDSSVTIVLHHKHEVDLLAKYFEGLEGRHKVKLVLSGDHPHYGYEERDGIAYVTAASMYHGPHAECDAFTMRVYPDHLQLDRHVLPPGTPIRSIEAPVTVWTCPGRFTPYERPEHGPDASGASRADAEARATPVETPRETLGSNLLANGDFENGIWYGRFRGWSPTGWCQWYTPPHAPEHVAEKTHPHSGTRFVRLHMWAYPWQAGILQTVRNVEPCHWYRLTGYGNAQPPDTLPSRTRIGIDAAGVLAEQFSADVSRHPADKYKESIGGDPRYDGWTAGTGMPEGIVWSPCQHPHDWSEFSIEAEALSDVVTIILSSSWQIRPEFGPIYETNWDTFAFREISWPTARLVPYGAAYQPHDLVGKATLRLHPDLDAGQVSWATEVPAGASQVVYRFLAPDDVNRRLDNPGVLPETLEAFPLETPVGYETSALRHTVAIEDLAPPETAVEVEVVALSRALVDGRPMTLASLPVAAPLP